MAAKADEAGFVPALAGARPPELRRYLLLLMLVLLFALSRGTEAWVLQISARNSRPWSEMLFDYLLRWVPWIILIPLLLKVVRAIRLDRPFGWRLLGMHLLIMIGTLVAHLALWFGCQILRDQLLFGSPPAKVVFWIVTKVPYYPVYSLATGLVLYPLLLIVSYMLDFRQVLRDRELQASQLEAQLAKAELKDLRHQIHPPFLVNALRSMASLLRINPEAAERMLDLLADLLRRTLRGASTQEVRLDQELAFVTLTLDIEALRLGEALAVRIACPSDLGEALVPHRILQPLVEHALRRGQAPGTAPLVVDLEARRQDENLVLTVRDSGPGPCEPQEATLQRMCGHLHQAFPGREVLQWRACQEGRFTATLTLPFRTAGGAP